MTLVERCLLLRGCGCWEVAVVERLPFLEVVLYFGFTVNDFLAMDQTQVRGVLNQVKHYVKQCIS